MNAYFPEKVELFLKDGSKIDFEMTQKLAESIREAFGLRPGDLLSESHVKYYLASSIKNYLSNQGSYDKSSDQNNF